jgi:hypothetical protein
LNEQGEVRLNRQVPGSTDEADPWLQRALRIEDSGWKGHQGTSMLRSPGIADYLRRLVGILAPRREIEFAFLELNGEPIAFEILLHAKGVLHSYKVGYDERFQWYDPGHLLMHELLRDTCLTRRSTGYDCLGPSNIGLQRWRGTSYSVGQLVIAPPRWLAQALMYTYRKCRPRGVPGDVNGERVESDCESPGTESPGTALGDRLSECPATCGTTP